MRLLVHCSWAIQIICRQLKMSKFIVFAILPLALASPPGISSVSTSKSQLTDLTLGSGSVDGYDRDLFPHWITQKGYIPWTK